MSQQRRATPAHLVMGFATNQSEASLRVFCQSLRAVYPPETCDLVIITNREEPYFQDLAELGVRFETTTNNWSPTTARAAKLVNRAVLHSFRLFSRVKSAQFREIADAYAVLLETWHHPQLARWFAYHRVLKLSSHYQSVFLADVKDVVFQAPFFPESMDESIALFQDVNPYGQCHWNDLWYREGYGRAAHAQVVGRLPVCIGTVMGTRQALLDLLSEFTAVMAADPFGRIEQAIFNHVLQTTGFKAVCRLRPNMSDVVATLGSDEVYAGVRVADGAIRRVRDESVLPVIHMYDRWPATLAFCLETYTAKNAHSSVADYPAVAPAAGYRSSAIQRSASGQTLAEWAQRNPESSSARVGTS